LIISLILISTINFIPYSNVFAQEVVSIAPGAANPNNHETFVPPQISLSSGSTISWTNDDSIMHTVTTQGNPLISPGYTWDNTFDFPGQFDYHCLIHPFMKGKVIIN
jgi:plastocyanin